MATWLLRSAPRWGCVNAAGPGPNGKAWAIEQVGHAPDLGAQRAAHSCCVQRILATMRLTGGPESLNLTGPHHLRGHVCI